MFLLVRWLTVGKCVRGVNLVCCLLQSPACGVLVIHKQTVRVLRAMQESKRAIIGKDSSPFGVLLMQASKPAATITSHHTQCCTPAASKTVLLYAEGILD